MGMSLPCVLEYFLHLARGCRSTLPAWLPIPNLASPDASLADALQPEGDHRSSFSRMQRKNRWKERGCREAWHRPIRIRVEG